VSIETEVKLLARRRTKIVATLGPASNDTDTITRLIQAGVSVFRLNMSHGDHAGHRETFQLVRRLAAEADRHIAILADLAGPKIRVGRFAGGSIVLELGNKVTVTTRDVPGEAGLIPSQYENLADDLSPGDRILLADGVMELEVEGIDGTEIHCVVTQGGVLEDRKGMNLPRVDVSAPCLTDKDKSDARFLLELGVDYLGLSFVRRASDVGELQSLIADSGGQAGIVAKIERPEALEDADAIVEAADAIMVARGDLGVELPPEQVPIAQRKLVDAARARNKPVIVATQMLESMIEHARPTRAEVSDVSHTVLSGADAIMLSGETATGNHPVLAVEMMNRIARQSEAYLWEQGAFGDFDLRDRREPPIPFGDAMARSSAQLSRDLRVRGILVISHSGMSAATMSSARPAAPVVSISSSDASCRRMALMWGVVPHLVEDEGLEDAIPMARERARNLGLAEAGEFVLLVRGFHADPVKNTPSITLLRV
jgi:pyruvate kinase